MFFLNMLKDKFVLWVRKVIGDEEFTLHYTGATIHTARFRNGATTIQRHFGQVIMGPLST